MPKFSYGKQKIIDEFQTKLDVIEKSWPMSGNYARVDPYLVPYLQGGRYIEILIYHIESKLWFDNTNHDLLLQIVTDHELVGEGDIVFDLGCNAGAITAVLATLVGRTGYVHAFDPYPWNAASTKCNAELNYLDNVTTYSVGISNRNYHIKVDPNDSRIFEQSSSDTSQLLKIESISRYMHLKPTFIKIDIEGSEHDLFENQQADTFSSVRRFALEFHPFLIRPRGLNPQLALENMERAGFSLHYFNPKAAPYDVTHYDDSHHLFWGQKKVSEAYEHVAWRAGTPVSSMDVPASAFFVSSNENTLRDAS